MNQPEEELLTIAEAAAKYRVSEEAIRRWIRAGHIPYTSVGPFGIKRIHASDLREKKVNGERKGAASETVSQGKSAGAGRDEEGPGRVAADPGR